MLPLLLFTLLFVGIWLVLRYWGPPVASALLSVSRRIGGRLASVLDERRAGGVARSWGGVAIVALAGVAVTTGSANLFFELAELLREETAVLERVDSAVHSNARLWVTPDATLFFHAMTVLGDPPVLGFVTLAVAVFLFARNHARWAAYLLVTVASGGVLNLLLKEWFSRERPDLSLALRHAGGYSFPSGHSMGAMVVFAAIGWLGVRILPSWPKDAAMTAFVTTVIAAIGTSRLYLGVHWFSDVVGGFAAGLAWVATMTTMFELWHRLPHRRRARRQLPD